jgi:two-component system response regulator RstA
MDTVTRGPLRINPASARADLDGKPLDLTSYEFSILYTLMKNAGRILSREQIMETAGGNPDEAFDRSVDVHISRLRKKLGDRSSRPDMIRTVRGLGYMFMADES